MRCKTLESETLTHHEWHPRPWDCSRHHHDPTRYLLDQSFETAPTTVVESARACSARSAAVGSSRGVGDSQQQTARLSQPHARARAVTTTRKSTCTRAAALLYHTAMQWQSTIVSRVGQLGRTTTKVGQYKLLMLTAARTRRPCTGSFLCSSIRTCGHNCAQSHAPTHHMQLSLQTGGQPKHMRTRCFTKIRCQLWQMLSHAGQCKS